MRFIHPAAAGGTFSFYFLCHSSGSHGITTILFYSFHPDVTLQVHHPLYYMSHVCHLADIR